MKNILYDNLTTTYVKENMWFNTLSEEQKAAIKKIDEMDSSTYILKKIKRKLKPQLKEGDVFAMLLPEGFYIFGRILKSGVNFWSEPTKYNVAFIFEKIGKDINDIPEKFDYDKILLGPILLSDGYWTRGYCYTVTNIPLTDKEKKLDYGFWDNGAKMRFLDADGKEMDHQPEYLSCYGLKTLYGLSIPIRKRIIADPDILPD